MKKKYSTKKNILILIVFYIGILFLWQLVYWVCTSLLELWKGYAFPSPVGVMESFLRMCRRGTFLPAIGYSMARVTVGFSLAIAIGFVMGILLTLNDKIARLLNPLMLGFQTLPSICWVPFAILWFGLKESAIIFVVVMGTVFSVALSVRSGVRNVNPLWIKAAKTMGVNQSQLYGWIMIPAALPDFVAGLRQGWSFAWRALLAGEVMGATVGLGYSLMMGRDLADINQVMLIMIVVVILGMLVDKQVFWRVEEYLLKKRGL